MREQVWFIVSKTNERRYATTRPPAGEWVEALKKEGYKIYRIEIEMPGDWDLNTDAALEGFDPEDQLAANFLGGDVTFAVPGQVAKLVPWIKTRVCRDARHVFVSEHDKVSACKKCGLAYEDRLP